MYVHLKQSGELLTDTGKPVWTPYQLRDSVDKIVSVYRAREELNVEGMLIVSGGGNIVRGDELRKHHIAEDRADTLGRLATAMNTIVLAETLKERRIPTAVFIANTMRIVDGSFSLPPYDPQAVCEAYDKEQVVLIAGGTGENNKSTDQAVLEYARRHREHNPEDELLLLKGTKFDGVFDGDPAINARAPRYSQVPAAAMLANYETHSAVDISCLYAIIASGLSLRVYADSKHDLTTVIAEGEEIGTLVVPGSSEPIFASDS